MQNHPFNVMLAMLTDTAEISELGQVLIAEKRCIKVSYLHFVYDMQVDWLISIIYSIKAESQIATLNIFCLHTSLC